MSKHFRLDAIKIKRAQKVLQVRTETEAIERALDLVISEHERNRLATAANERFVKSSLNSIKTTSKPLASDFAMRYAARSSVDVSKSTANTVMHGKRTGSVLAKPWYTTFR